MSGELGRYVALKCHQIGDMAPLDCAASRDVQVMVGYLVHVAWWWLHGMSTWLSGASLIVFEAVDDFYGMQVHSLRSTRSVSQGQGSRTFPGTYM